MKTCGLNDYIQVKDLVIRLDELAKKDGFVGVDPGRTQQDLLVQLYGTIIEAAEDQKRRVKHIKAKQLRKMK